MLDESHLEAEASVAALVLSLSAGSLVADTEEAAAAATAVAAAVGADDGAVAFGSDEVSAVSLPPLAAAAATADNLDSLAAAVEEGAMATVAVVEAEVDDSEVEENG